ncbi:MAG: S-layer homology domain-containing protein, partial [Clostridia bacterium]|nr:S-layer homology domain-containing protein [Clostridia bacterium]
RAKIASWAAEYMAALTKRGYVNGDPQGNSNPEDYISREEFAQFMHNAIRTYITKPGTYSGDFEGITVVRVDDVVLKDLKTTSDLIIGDGVGKGNITINGVTIEKRLLARGGTIKVTNSKLGENVVVNNVNGITYFKNYRYETFFKGIVENTKAQFLVSSSGSYVPPSPTDTVYTLNLWIDGILRYTVTVTNGAPDITVPDPTKDYYTFDGWYDASGNKITNFGSVTSDMELHAEFIPIPYKVEYKDVTWKPGCEPTDAEKIYNIETVNSFVLPAGTDVVAPSGEEFKYWKNYDTGVRVDVLTITQDTPDIIYLTPHFDPIPSNPVTVTFYRIYSDLPPFIIEPPLSIEKGTKVNVADFPNAQDFARKGYTEDANVASLYAGNEWTHEIAPEFWYVKNGVMTAFDENVVVNEDTSVYLLSRSLTLMLNYDGLSQPLSVSADYNKDTRLVNSIKDIIAKSGRNQLQQALANNMIPNYDEMVAKVVDKMVSAGVIELDGDKKNIQLIDVPFKISTCVKEDVANGMIKKYLRDVVKTPAELDKIFSIIDVAEFADDLGIDTIIANMSDAEIASLIKDDEYKDDIIDFVLSDLKKTDSTMIDFVIDYVITDEGFRDDLIEQIIADLKDKTKTSTLKTKALEYIKAQIDDQASAFYTRFVDMIAADLKSQTSVVMDAVVNYIRTNLKANTDEGKALRKEILTSPQLPEFLADEKMKVEVIKLALTDAFIDKALNNADYREILVEAIMKDEDFIDLLLASTEFHDYIIDQLHPVGSDANAHPLAKDVEDLIADTDSAFRKYVLDLVKDSDEFTELFESHPELIGVVSDEIKWSDFVPDENDLLKFVFKQSGAVGTYSFISRDDIENEFASKYNALQDYEKIALTGNAVNYESLSEQDKQTVRNKLYEDAGVKAEILTEVQNKFNSYKSDMVTKITTGKADEITDPTVINLIDELLAEYVTKYIEQQKLHADDAIDASIAGVIEEILFGFIADLIKGEDLNNDDLEKELDDMLSHIETIKHQFVVDPSDDVVARLKTIVKNYRDTHQDNINKVIDDNYTELTNKIVAMLNPDDSNSVYGEVESTLKGVADTIGESVIKDYVTKIAENDLKDLIKKYIKNVTVTDLNTYIASFLTVDANVTTVRTELSAFVQDANQKDTVKSFAKTYISDPLNETDIITNITAFIRDIDETFVNKNRTVIEDALKSMDITAFVDEQFIKDYVAGLSDSEKNDFADLNFNTLQKNQDYKTFMTQLFGSNEFVVNKSNVSMLSVISTSIRGLTFDSVIGYIDNSVITKLMDTVGADYVKALYNKMMSDYCDGFDSVINEVKLASDSSFKKSYTTSLVLKLNIFDIYERLYDKAADKVIEKISNANVYYDENKYLQFLVEQDFLSYLVDGDKSLASGNFTGYSLKDTMAYYDYLTMLLIVGDDAITWYGDEKDGLSQAQFEALYDAMFDKIFAVHENMNNILIAFKDDGTLPSKVHSAVDSIEKLNSMMVKFGDKSKSFIEKYLGSNLNVKFEDQSIAQDGKVVKMIDFLVGNDNPVINIGTIYATIYEYDDNIQAKLKQLIESDKFKAAIDKFETSSFGEMLSGRGTLGTIGDKLDELRNNGRIESALDSVYDFFYLVANEGIEAFKVPAAEMKVTDIDIYEVKIGKVEITVKRTY